MKDFLKMWLLICVGFIAIFCGCSYEAKPRYSKSDEIQNDSGKKRQKKDLTESNKREIDSKPPEYFEKLIDREKTAKPVSQEPQRSSGQVPRASKDTELRTGTSTGSTTSSSGGQSSSAGTMTATSTGTGTAVSFRASHGVTSQDP